jgi:hypothetical protein
MQQVKRESTFTQSKRTKCLCSEKRRYIWDISGKFLINLGAGLKFGQAINTLRIRTGFIQVIAYYYVV